MTMKRKLLNSLFATLMLFSLVAPLSMKAQSTPGCDGKRYLLDIFTDTIRTVVTYGDNVTLDGYNQILKMDVVEPKGDTLKKRPVIIWAFGGGYVSGNRNQMDGLCVGYAKKGYVNVTIDYRLFNYFALGYPDSVGITKVGIQASQDMKAAIRYLRKEASLTNKFKIDTNNIIVGGISAGALTAMTTAMLDSTDVIDPLTRRLIGEVGGLEGTSGTPGYSSKVKGVVSMAGGLYRKEYITVGNPPFAAYHGTADKVVPYGYGVNVYGYYNDGDAACYDRARALGIPAVLFSVMGGDHPSAAAGIPSFDAWSPYMTRFMKQLVCGETITSESKSTPTDELSNRTLTVYPNPAFDKMTVELDQNTEGANFDILVYDIAGKQVYAKKGQSGNQFSLDKKYIGRGMFFLRLNFANAEGYVLKKIVFN